MRITSPASASSVGVPGTAGGPDGCRVATVPSNTPGLPGRAFKVTTTDCPGMSSLETVAWRVAKPERSPSVTVIATVSPTRRASMATRAGVPLLTVSVSDTVRAVPSARSASL